VLNTLRLNSVTHKPQDKKEKQRILERGGHVTNNKLNNKLSVSRAIGNKSYQSFGLIADATIDILSIPKLKSTLDIGIGKIESIKIISTTDGFTDGTLEQTKKGHELYLLEALQGIKFENEAHLSHSLANIAIEKGSQDNISVAIQTLGPLTPPFILGLYDGYCGAEVSTHLALNITPYLLEQCKLAPYLYAKQTFSVNKNMSRYHEDNFAIDHQETY
ncbi:MAG: protein phosphatase, partial [Legionella sp.]|nr:protein phosphatase [Legionella sp.]